ncbi:MAG: glycerophosphodiester phosphodiesterase [Rhizobiales bacterium]|nr:glycerophosphodiester phosphodiesterase [Hyphomicrobiales bacterium]MBO6699830.1 glycerophosphodiester phosphodiesterase [Hyphomicrobiales bacterium]MBO6737368.1 glycerophosphodiester phosphodiesterase [Hyphomicrobiales bacterium]MBO6911558.1 glycerophosphodiester phosphodiesterase [Hyphomicrobiales bacterium]MBO6955142.1 glycerophosphodiester phosphodiesterase [Hyphomicrobiales bacterium]
MRWVVRFVLLVLVIGGALWIANTSLFSDGGETQLLAHRGVHQTFPMHEVGNDTCTAVLIREPTHAYLENSIPSMNAAFEAGASVVELDVHLTPDGHFAVFHDWTLDCRTDGTGVTHEIDMATLRELDIGYGYTADGGETFPFRGEGIGMMPTLVEVFDLFPNRQFLINFKSRHAREGEALAELINGSLVARAATFGVYGGRPPTETALADVEGLRGYTRRSLLDCGRPLLALGWSGYVPEPCRDTLLILPINIAPFVWGYPHRLTERLARHGTSVILIGPYSGGGFSSGVDDEETLAQVPDSFDGYVWTNRIEVIGPLLEAR